MRLRQRLLTTILILSLTVAAGFAGTAPAYAKLKYNFGTPWVGGREVVQELVNRFNVSQNEYRVNAVSSWNYSETMTAAIAAYRARNHPHIVQVFEVGTQTMLMSGAVYPVYQLMADQGYDIDWDSFVAPVWSYYSTAEGTSTPCRLTHRRRFSTTTRQPLPRPASIPIARPPPGKRWRSLAGG